MNLHYIPLVLALSSTAALAAPGYDLASRANSSAQTASTAGATNAGNAQSVNSYAPANSTVRSNPAIGIPSGASAFSPFNCANVASAGASGWFVAFGGSAPIESDECNGRANVTILMQMANAIRDMSVLTPQAVTMIKQGNKYVPVPTPTIPASPDMRIIADRLVTVAMGVMCDQDDKLRAKMAAQGLCDHADYDGNKRTYHVARGNALGYYPE